MALSKETVQKLLQINNLEEFREAVAKTFPGQRSLTPDVIGAELANHWEKLLWGEKPETVENHSDPKGVFVKKEREVIE